MIMVLRSAITERQIVDEKTREKNHRKWLWELIHHTLEKFFDISDTRPVTVYLDSVTYNLCRNFHFCHMALCFTKSIEMVDPG